jgi:hypothetical protein
MFFIFYKLPTATKVFVYRDFALANVNSLKLSWKPYLSQVSSWTGEGDHTGGRCLSAGAPKGSAGAIRQTLE